MEALKILKLHCTFRPEMEDGTDGVYTSKVFDPNLME